VSLIGPIVGDYEFKLDSRNQWRIVAIFWNVTPNNLVVSSEMSLNNYWFVRCGAAYEHNLQNHSLGNLKSYYFISEDGGRTLLRKADNNTRIYRVKLQKGQLNVTPLSLVHEFLSSSR
jgi:hypothetical protein